MVALVLLVTAILGACNSSSLSAAQSEYHAEYGERFLIPDPVVKNADENDVTFVVTDSEGKEVTRAQLGSFYPEIGEYTLTFTLGSLSASAKIVCSDTKGPAVEYTDHVRTVFEGDEFAVPTFTATDISGVDEQSESLKIYLNEEGGAEQTASEGKLTAAAGAKAYLFEYKVKDTHGNESVTVLKTDVKADYDDPDIAEGTMWDFDEAGYANLVAEHTAYDTQTAEFSIVQGEPGGVKGGALKLTCSEDGVFAGVRLLRGKTVNTGEISRIVIRLYADNELSIFSVGALREDLAAVEYADLSANVWHTLEINPRALHPDQVDVSELEIRFRNTGTTNVYIDEIYAVSFYEDEELAEGCLGDFDEEGYLANIEQAGYDIGKGMITAEYDIIAKEDLPEGELRDGASEGGVLKVDCNDVWTEDFAGYGVLGDGVKYYFPQEINTKDIKQLYIKIYCADGADMALSFCYRDPNSDKILRSKARWLRGTVGQWNTMAISYEQITQIVPMYEITGDDDEPITDFDLTAIVITSCGNVPDHTTPCKQFYLDEISYIGDFTDVNLSEGYFADFDESGYVSRIDQAWREEMNTATYEVLAAGDPAIPAGAEGGVLKVTAKQASGIIIPNQGERGDGVRFYLFDPILFSDLESITIRAYGAAGQGTAVNVGFIIVRDGVQTRSNAWWQQVPEGAWGDITMDKARLSIADDGVPRLQPDDEIIGIAIWASSLQSGLSFAKEFYIDSIRYTSASSQPQYPDPVLGENCLIDFKDANDASRISQSTDMWPGQSNGGAQYAIISKESEADAAIYDYEWFNTEEKKSAFRSFEGSVLEVVSRTGSMDGAKVTFYKPFSYAGMATLDITVFSPCGYDSVTNSDGYIFYIEDSEGNVYEWRIHSSGFTGAADYKYTLYEWSKLSLDISVLKGAGLKDVAAISFVYGSPTNNAGYLYVKPIVFTPESEVVEPEPPADNILTDFTGEGDASRISQSTDMWSGQSNGGAEYAVISKEDEANAAIYDYEWFNTDERKAAFRSFEGSVLEVVSRTGSMDGAKFTFASPYSFSGMATLDINMFSASANGGYVVYIADSEGTTYDWRIAATDYSVYTWTVKSLDVSALEEAGLKDIASVSFVYGAGANISYLYIQQIAFTPAA